MQTANDLNKWAELLSTYFVPLEANIGTPDDNVSGSSARFFSGRIAGHQWGSMTLAQLAVNSHSVTRNSALIGTDDPGYLKLFIQDSGRGIIMQDGKEAVLETGEFAFFDSCQPYTVLFDDESTSQVILFPRHLLHLPTESLSDLSVTPFRQNNPLSQAVAGFAQQCGHTLLNLREPVSRRLTENLVDLLGTVVTNELYADDRSSASSAQQRRRDVITAFIKDNLDNTHLGPHMIAAAHFMSVRSLHLLFEDTGETVSSIVRALRLERCRIQLEDPSQDTIPMSAIAAQWGFADSAHFSRAFRQAYGTSPSKWRANR